METGKVQSFVNKINQDPALQNKVESATVGARGDVNASLEALATVAQAEGYNLSNDDFQQYYREKLVSQNGELSDAALDAVAGGAASWWFLKGSDGSWIGAIVTSDDY